MVSASVHHEAVPNLPARRYDKCGLTFDKGCVVCPAGYQDYGCLCEAPGTFYFKDWYGRGVGEPMVCADTQEESYGLCYPLCTGGYEGKKQ